MVTNTTFESLSEEAFAHRMNELFNYATAIIGLSYWEIRNTYRHRHPVAKAVLYAPGKEERIIDLVFESGEVVLTVMFNNKELCDYVIISFSTFVSPEQCINYLHNNYAYDYSVNRWALPGYRLFAHRGATPGSVSFSITS